MDPIVAALIAAIGAGVTALWRAFLKQDVVPGTLYRAMEARAVRAEERADKADTQAERNTEALEAVTATVKLSLEQRAASRPASGPAGRPVDG